MDPGSNSDDRPLVTIVTSTFNAAKDLERTAASIRAQTLARIQWIIADGASKDGTIEIIQSLGDLVDTWFSERDEGIYDAWNKALRRAKGDWVQFLGAGDELASPDCLERMAPHLEAAHPRYDLVYGRILLISEEGRNPIEEIGVPWEELKGRWRGGKLRLPVHPEVFHHRSILQGPKPFDRRFRIAGDSHMLLRNVLKKDPLYVPILVDRMPVGGVSDKISSAWKLARELRQINRDLGLRPPLANAAMDWAQLLAKQILLPVLPRKALLKVGDLWRVVRGRKKRFTVE